MKKYIVQLTDEERATCRAILNKGRCLASRRKRARILLLTDIEGRDLKDSEVAEAVPCARATVENIRRRFVTEGFEASLERKPQLHLSRQRKLDGRGEARLIALACSEPPKGRERWTLQLLADELVRLEVVDSISDQTVRGTLKKMKSNRTFADAG